MDTATYVPFALADEARHYYQSIASDAEVLRAIAAAYPGGTLAFAADVYEANGYNTSAAMLRDAIREGS